MSMQTIRPYEMSVWTLRDSYLATLKAPGVENKGHIEEPEFSLKNDGTLEIKFKVPMYYWNNNKLIENPYWYDVKHGLLMTGLRKIKLIFNKRTKDEAIYEFLVTSIVEEHASNGSLYCSVTASGLTFQELGKKGYNISLSSDDFLLDYSDFMDWLDNEAEENSWDTEKYNIELEKAPKQNINYWCDKVFANSDWNYSIQMNWFSHDGLLLYVLDSQDGTTPLVNIALVNKARIPTTEEIKTLQLESRQYFIDNRLIKYEDLTEEEKEKVNEFRENLGLRRNDTIYEDDYISSWDVDVENQKITPAKYEKYREKWRPVDAEKSNIYNLTQTIAEAFGVFCKYKFHYDDNYHIIKKEVIFYNTFLDEFNKDIDLTYGYGVKNIKRTLDSNDIFTKMIVNSVDDENSPTGILSILNTPANAIGENYILNFDYLYETGSIAEDQYLAVEDFKQTISFLNQKIKENESVIADYQVRIPELEADINFSNNVITQAQTQIEESLSAIKAITENETGTIQADKVFARFQQDSDGTYYIKITEKGVQPGSIQVHTNINLTDSSLIPRENYNIITDSNGNIEKLGGFVLTKEQANTLYAYLSYTYSPQLYHENVINTFLILMKKHKQLLETNTELLEKLQSELDSMIESRNNILEEKQKAIADFEKMMGPALREGNWRPDNYNSLYSTKKYDAKISANVSKMNENTDDIFNIFWDNEEFEGENVGYRKIGITENIESYPCIKLDNFDLLKTISQYLNPESEEILRYCYEEILAPSLRYEETADNKFSYSTYISKEFVADTQEALNKLIESAGGSISGITYNENNNGTISAVVNIPKNFLENSYAELENAILEEGLKALTNQDDVSKCTSSQINQVRETYGLTRYNYKYLELGADLIPGFIKNEFSNIIPVLFLVTDNVGFTGEELKNAITLNGKLCLMDMEVISERVDNNILTSTTEDLSDIPSYTDYTNTLVDEKITVLYNTSKENDFLFDYKQNGYFDVFPRLRVNDLTLNDNNIKLISIEPLRIWTKYENYSVLIREDSYLITPDSQCLIYRWSERLPQELEENNIIDILELSFNIEFQLSNAELSIYLDALEVSKINAFPQVSYEIEISDLNEDFIKTSYNQLNKIIHINDWELKFKNVLGYITEITMYLNEPWKDKVVVKNYKTKFEDLFSKIVVSSQQIQANLPVYNRAAAAFDSSGLIKENIIQDSLNNGRLSLSFLKGDLTLDQNNGILAKSDNGILMFNNEGIFTATEKDEENRWIWNTSLTPFGLNASLLKAGTIDTNLIRIYAGENLRFQMNADGLFAFRASEDGQTNQNEYVVHNSEGLFLVNKNDSQIINRVEVSWEGLIIRNLNNERVFYADNYGNLTLSGTINAVNGTIGGWHIVDKGLYSTTQNTLNEAAGIASGIITGGTNVIDGANNLYKVFWAGRDNNGNSRFYVDSNGDLFVNSAVFSEAIVTPQITINGINLSDVMPEFNNSGNIGLTALDGNVFRIDTTGNPEKTSLRFAISGNGVDSISNIQLQKYSNNNWNNIETSFNGTTYLTFSINYANMNLSEDSTTFKLSYKDVNNLTVEEEFTINLIKSADIIIVDVIANPTNNFNNGLAAGYNVNQLILQANVYKNGILIENPASIYNCQWYKKVYNNNNELTEQIIPGATNFILNVNSSDLINKRSATYVCKISN